MAGIKDPITDTQRAAARALIEGEAPTHGRVAACTGVNVTMRKWRNFMSASSARSAPRR